MVATLFRKPEFPLLIETDEGVKGAKSLVAINKMITDGVLLNKGDYQLVDSTGENWEYIVEHDVIHPLTFGCHRWTKKKIMEFYNSTASSEGKYYELKNVGNKRLDTIVKEITELASIP